ncbi:septal ring lytic transglycosylase RlpA family protein [Pseudodesulfovibrio thermohalotolerans]|jgi:rare lipoprotein A|uniref:septal ring lytic transglycosylase RlpA family protein n=1 Tax=Pseudodesulfovibrio thermohalotolerans TaxID=2880651 RepID=UPI00244312AA|nr:septal ring lytic transglycosylase RlpA family protein [Pseudodesulfovibrio thermohalotolerans]WFS61433.1 septal ring lytic transglycosylase RlpA family protein [Pseudodesulfovibrio thermohalotolerans]
MRHLAALFAISVLLALAGCGPKHVPSTPPASGDGGVRFDPKTRPYTVLGKTYYPLQSASGYDEIGLASWYGADFHGRKTANGQTYNMYGVSAAHKTLPLGTRVRVTNLENDRTVVLTINDRGPFVNERILDLSYGAARKLGTVERGVAKVRVTSLTTEVVPTRLKDTPGRLYHVRVGAFAVRDNALRVHRQLLASGYSGANITVVDRDGQMLHIVQAGSFKTRDQAERVMEALKREFPTCYIIS